MTDADRVRFPFLAMVCECQMDAADQVRELFAQRDEAITACKAALIKLNAVPLDKVSIAADMVRTAIARVEAMP